MATRLYHASTGATAISPAYDASWTLNTAVATRNVLTHKPTDTSMNAAIWTRATGSASGNGIMQQSVSVPLPANKTISGNVTVAFGHRNSGQNSSIAAVPRAVVKVVTPAGAVRGVLATLTGGAASGYPFFRVDALTATMTTVNALAGDYIVIERGMSSSLAATGTLTLNIHVGDSFSTTDAVDGYTTAAFDARPWTEFSQDDIWGPPKPTIAGESVAALEAPSRTPSRLAGMNAGVLEAPARTPLNLAGMSVQVLIPRAGQRIRTVHAAGFRDRQIRWKRPDGTWAVLNPKRPA